MSVSPFAQVLQALSRLVSASQEEQLKLLAPKTNQPDALLEEALRRGWITRFQRQHVANGRTGQLVLGPYVLLDVLGEGGMGMVYRARHKVMRREMAIKVLRPELTQNAEVVRRFRREVEIAATLAHPNVVHAYDAGEDGGRHYLVMELIEGLDLQELVRQRGPLPIAQACDLIRQAALGLQYAHERGLVHRDVKPQNLMVVAPASGGREPPVDVSFPEKGASTGGSRPPLAMVLKILDLGLARLALLVEQQTAVSFRTRAGSFLGTPDFLAPEQALDPTKADIRSDIYGLGCTLHFLLAGKPPFPEEGSMTQKLLWHQQQEPPSIGSLRRDVPPPLGEYVRRMLAKQPQQRPQTPAEVAQALTAWAGAAARPAPSVMAGPGPLPVKEGSWSLPPPADPEPLPVAVYPTYDRPAYPSYERPASAASEAPAPGRSSAWPYILVPLLTLLLTGGILLAINFWPHGSDSRVVSKEGLKDEPGSRKEAATDGTGKDRVGPKEKGTKDAVAKDSKGEIDEIKDEKLREQVALLAKTWEVVLETPAGDFIGIKDCLGFAHGDKVGDNVGPYLSLATDVRGLRVQMFVPFDLLKKWETVGPHPLGGFQAQSHLFLKHAQYSPEKPYFPGGKVMTQVWDHTGKQSSLEGGGYSVWHAPAEKKRGEDGHYVLEIRDELTEELKFSTILRTAHFLTSTSSHKDLEHIRSTPGDMTGHPALGPFSSWRMKWREDGRKPTMDEEKKDPTVRTVRVPFIEILHSAAKSWERRDVGSRAHVAGVAAAGFLLRVEVPERHFIELRRLAKGEEDNYVPALLVDIYRDKGDKYFLLKGAPSDPFTRLWEPVYRLKDEKDWLPLPASVEVVGTQTFVFRFRGLDFPQVERNLSMGEGSKDPVKDGFKPDDKKPDDKKDAFKSDDKKDAFKSDDKDKKEPIKPFDKDSFKDKKEPEKDSFKPSDKKVDFKPEVKKDETDKKDGFKPDDKKPDDKKVDFRPTDKDGKEKDVFRPGEKDGFKDKEKKDAARAPASGGREPPVDVPSPKTAASTGGSRPPLAMVLKQTAVPRGGQHELPACPTPFQHRV